MSEHIDTEPAPAPAVPYLRWWPDGGIALGLALGSVAIICATCNHYGLTYDEGWYLSKSVLARQWVGSLVTRPGEALSAEGIRKHWYAERQTADGTLLQEQQPGAAKLVNGVLGYPVGRLFGVDPPERAGTALFVGAALAALYLFLAPLWGRVPGLLASLLLLSMPRAFAHAHLCALDAPVMSASFVTVALAFWGVLRGRLLWTVLAGLVFGVALGCKINAVFVPLIAAIWVLALHRDRALALGLSLLLGGLAGFFITWPWLWHDPWSRLVEYALFHLEHYPVAVSYFGRISAHQPWHYPLVMTAITTPPLTLLAAAGGGIVAARTLRQGRAPQQLGPWRRSQALLVLLGWVLNIALNCLPNAPKYGGVRLFLPCFVYVAALAGLGFSWLLEALDRSAWLKGGSTLTPRRVGAVIGLAFVVASVRSVVWNHPYQLSYYNASIGGVHGAVERGMEATYWGDSYLAATGFVADHMRPDDLVWVDLPGCEWIIRHYLSRALPDPQVTSGGFPPREAEWCIVQNKASELRPETLALVRLAQPVYLADLDGVPLSLVYDRAAVQQVLGAGRSEEPE